MNLFAFAGLACGISCAVLALIAFVFGKTKLHRLLAFFNVAVSIWGFGGFFVGKATTPEAAIFGWKFAHIGGMFVSILFFHLVCTFCQVWRRPLIIFGYSQAVIFNIISWILDILITKTRYTYSLYYNDTTFLFSLAVLSYLILVFASFWELIKHYKVSDGLQKRKTAYVILGFLIGFIGGTSTFLPEFRIDLFYPSGNLGIVVYCLVVTYAILKYNILDIKIAISRVGIFIIVYSIVLGIPYGLAILGRDWLEQLFGGSWFWFPMNSLLILATSGPFIYIYLQQKTEKRLLQEEHRTQELLLQASYGMNTIHNLERLVDLIVEVVMKILRVNKAEIFLQNKEGNQYALAAPRNSENKSIFISVANPMVEILKTKKSPIVYEEAKVISTSENRGDYKSITKLLEKMSVSVVTPIVIDGALSGFLTLGGRKSKEMFSKDLLNALTVLGNQAALAIENCHYLEAETKRMQQEGLRERMESLDHMASSMAHEIDNPMHGVRTSLAFIKDFIIKDPRFSISEPLSGDLNDAIKRIENCSERVSNMIKAILDYSRLGTGQLMPVRINESVEGFLELISPQIKKEKVDFKVDVEESLPYVLGDKIQLEEILMNFVRNSLHAVKLEEHKKISIKIFKKNPKVVRIECSDNGYGIKKEILNDIFLSSMTTKGSTEGTGLGLYRVRKIIDLFKGRVWAESEGKGKGATFIVELPVLEGNMEEILKNNINGNGE